MADTIIKFSDFSGGYINSGESLFDFPTNALTGTSKNLEVTNKGLNTRKGFEISGYLFSNPPDPDDDLGPIIGLKQVRFQTEDRKFLLAEGVFCKEDASNWGHSLFSFVGTLPTAGYFTEEYQLIPYDITPIGWTLLTPSGTAPTPRNRYAVALDTANRQLVYFGGELHDATYTNEVHKYNIDTNTWSGLITCGGVAPTARLGARAFYDAANHRMIVYGGKTLSAPATYSNQIHYLDLITNTWSGAVATSGTPPPATTEGFFAAAIWDSTAHRLVVFGDTGGSQNNPYIRAFNPTTSAWSELASTGTSPYFANGYTMWGVYDAATDTMRFMTYWTSPKGLYTYNLSTGVWTLVADSALNDYSPVVHERRLLSVYGDAHGINLDTGTHVDPIALAGTAPTFGDSQRPGSVYDAVTDLFFYFDNGDSFSNPINDIYELNLSVAETPSAVDDRECSITSLLDAAIIASDSAAPVVFSGAKAVDASNWPYPLSVLLTLEGGSFDDITADVCDPDSATTAQIGGIRPEGGILIRTRDPLNSAIWVEVASPNTGGVSVLESHVHMPFSTAAYIDRADLKSTITNWILDTPGNKTGHFEDSLSNPVTLGAGNTAPDVETGLVVVGASASSFILSITPDGEGADEVTMEDALASQAITGIYGIHLTDADVVTVAHGEADTMAAVYSKTLAGGPQLSGYSLRIIHAAADITASGNGYIQVTFKNTTAYTVTVNNVGFGERSGATDDTVTTPVELLFGGASGFVLGSGSDITCDRMAFTLDETKDHLAIVDIAYVTQTQRSGGGTQLVDNPAYAAWLAKMNQLRATQPGSQIPETYYVGNTPYTHMVTNPAWTAWNTEMTACLASQPPQKISEPVPVQETVFPIGGFGEATGSGYYKKASAATYADTTVTGFTAVSGMTLAVSAITTNTNPPVIPAPGYVVLTTDTSHGYVGHVEHLTSFDFDYTAPAGTSLFGAVSFDKRATFWIWKAAAWYEVVREDAGAWQYRDINGAWQNASVDDRKQALKETFAVAINQVAPAAYEALVQADIESTNGFVPHETSYVDWAFFMDGSASAVSTLTSVKVFFQDLGTTAVTAWNGTSWDEGSGWTDGTEVGGVCFAQTGIIDYDGATPFEAEYLNYNNIPGFWYKINVTTSADCEISQIRVQPPTQLLSNIGDGQPVAPLAVLFNDVTNANITDYTITLTDNIWSTESAAVLAMDTSAELFIGMEFETFGEIEIIPFVGNELDVDVRMFYWNGLQWTPIAAADGTANAGKCLTKRGKITWPIPDDWRTCVPLSIGAPRAHYVKLMVSASLSATTSLAEIAIYPQPQALKKYAFAEAFNGRLALGKRSDAPDQVDVSRQYAEYGFCGADSWKGKGNSIGGITAMTTFQDQLFVSKVDSWNQLTGIDPTNFSLQSIEAARYTPINSEVIIKAKADFGNGLQDASYFLNRHGAFAQAGLHLQQVWNTARSMGFSKSVSWWDEEGPYPRLDLDNLGWACGAYYPPKNWLCWAVPFMEDGNTVFAGNTHLIVLDLNNMVWLPPMAFEELITGTSTPFTIWSLALCYHDTGSVGLYAGTDGGRMVQLLSGVTDGTGNDANDIEWIAETGWFGDEQWTSKLTALKVYGSQQTGGTITVELFTDGNQTAIVFDQTFTISTLAGLSGKDFADYFIGRDKKANFFKLRFTGTGWVKDLRWSVGLDADEDRMS